MALYIIAMAIRSGGDDHAEALFRDGKLDRVRTGGYRDRGLSLRSHRGCFVSHVRIRTHPGEVLREEFMKPLGLSANALARALRVPPNRITGIIAREKPRSVTPDTALRLARFFRTTPRFWLNLQAAYEL
jgi:addiction module HigA family antidote